MKRNGKKMCNSIPIAAMRADPSWKTVMFRFLLKWIPQQHPRRKETSWENIPGILITRLYRYSHPRAHLKFEDRERLGKAWNNGLRTKPSSISIPDFAKAYGVSRTLWRRELQRRTSGAILTPDIRRRGKHERRFDYIEYDAEAAQRHAEQQMKNKGPRIKTSSFAAEQISNTTLNDKMPSL